MLDAGFEEGLFIPVPSAALPEELIHVLGRPATMKRAQRNLAELAAFHRLVKRESEVIEGDYQGLDIVPRDATGQSYRGGCPGGPGVDLVSQDDDLLSLKVLRMPGHRPVQIVTPRAFLRLLGR